MNTARDAYLRLGGDLAKSYEGICPLQLAYLAVLIEENSTEVLNELDNALARGANLDLIWPMWALWLFEKELQKFKTSAPIAALFQRVVDGDQPTQKEWDSARTASVRVTHEMYVATAASVASSAAWAMSSAVSTGYAAEEAASVASKVAYAAWEKSVADAAKASAEAAWTRMAEQLRRLLREATT